MPRVSSTRPKSPKRPNYDSRSDKSWRKSYYFETWGTRPNEVSEVNKAKSRGEKNPNYPQRGISSFGGSQLPSITKSETLRESKSKLVLRKVGIKAIGTSEHHG